jgi:hypothetical protein
VAVRRGKAVLLNGKFEIIVEFLLTRFLLTILLLSLFLLLLKDLPILRLLFLKGSHLLL